MNFGNLDFDIVSDFELRISSLCYINSTKYYVRNYQRIMQNKPNFQKSQMNLNIYAQKYYENKRNWTLGENKPNQSQFPKGQNELKIIRRKIRPHPNQTTQFLYLTLSLSLYRIFSL